MRHAFHLANFDAKLRTLPVEFGNQRIFVVPAGAALRMGDRQCLEVVLGALSGRTLLVTGDVAAPMPGVRVTSEVISVT